jgi:hypothetical protein
MDTQDVFVTIYKCQSSSNVVKSEVLSQWFCFAFSCKHPLIHFFVSQTTAVLQNIQPAPGLRRLETISLCSRFSIRVCVPAYIANKFLIDSRAFT